MLFSVSTSLVLSALLLLNGQHHPIGSAAMPRWWDVGLAASACMLAVL
jgi:hypothetical protein